MRGLRYAVAVAISASILTGCSDSGGGGGSSLENQITLPDDSDVPSGPVEEGDSDGTDSRGAGFSGRRFWTQGDQDPDYPSSGLWAIPASANTSPVDIDSNALPERQFFTIPSGDQELAPHGVFYRRSDGLFYVPVADGESSRQVSSESSISKTCIADFAFDTAAPNNTAISYNLARDTSTNECPSRFEAGLQWHQVQLSNSGSDAPADFSTNQVVPVVPLNAKDGGVPQWLVLDRSTTPNELARVGSDDLGTSTPVDTSSLQGTLEEVHRIARLGTDSLILAYGTPAEGDTSAEYRLAHYDRNANSLTDLEAGSGLQGDTLARLPQSNWITTSGNSAYIGLGNALLEVDAQGYSLLDAVEGSGRPFFVIASDTHVVWGALSSSDGEESRMVRIARQGGSGGSVLVNAPYMESRVRGTANGWIYFTVARGVQENGRLDTGFAIGINPEKSSNNAFILEDAQWIGSSIQPTTTAAPQDLATAPINNLFYRGGDDDTMRDIKAVEDPASPLAQVDGNTQLPAVTLGTLPERFSAVFMGEGFGPQRLLTAVSVDADEDLGGDGEIGNEDLSISNRVYHLNPQNADSLGNRISEEEGSLVRALPLF